MTNHLRPAPSRPGAPAAQPDPHTAALDHLAAAEAGTLVGGAMNAPFLAVPVGPRSAAVPILCGPAHVTAFVNEHRDLLGLPGGLWLQVWKPRQTLLVIDLANRSQQTLHLRGDFGQLDTTALELGPPLEDRIGLLDWNTTPTEAHATFRFDVTADGGFTLIADRFPDPAGT